MEWTIQVAANGKNAWFNLPVSRNAIEYRLGELDDYVITDYDLPFKIKEGISIEKLNDFANRFEQLSSFLRKNASAIIEAHYSGIEEFLDNAENLTVINAENKKDLGYALIDMGIRPEELMTYFNYAAYGRDFGIETGGVFIDGAYVY